MKLKLIGVTTVVTLAVSAAGAADIMRDCADDVAQYCEAVEPGYGRLLSCLYAHETVISDACLTATSGVGDLLDYFFERTRYVQQECGEDIRSLCSDIAVGEGRLYTCLAEQDSDLSDSCAGAVDRVERPQE